jgi:Zn-dependent protease
VNLWSIVSFVLFIPSIAFHEFMHGYAAHRLGDPTAKDAGRLTLNPIASIDPFGTVLLPLMGMITGGPIFGYAKPVPYNPMYFKNLRQGELITGFAGPASNLVLALFGAGMAWVGFFLLGVSPALAQGLAMVGFLLAQVNLVLMFFNLLPIPPLDGSSIVPVFLPDSALPGWYQLQRYSFVIFIVIIILLPRVFPSFNPVGAYFGATVYPILGFLIPFVG